MRTLTLLTTTLLLLGLGGCQHLQLMSTTPDQTTASAANMDTKAESPQPQYGSVLRQFWTAQFGQDSIQDYPAACLAQSQLSQAIVVGQVIDTPRYAMITLAKQQQQAQLMGGELCIVNKISHHVEITAVDDLRFVTPASNPLPAATQP